MAVQVRGLSMSDEQGQQIIYEMKRIRSTVRVIAVFLIVQVAFILWATIFLRS